MKKTTIKFPDTEMALDMRIGIQAPKPLGVTAKVYVMEQARKLPDFNQEIDCSASGQDKDDKKIEVDSLGRWLFGVPGYTGHIRISPVDDKVMIYYPKKAPKVVHEFLLSLKESIENNQTNI